MNRDKHPALWRTLIGWETPAVTDEGLVIPPTVEDFSYVDYSKNPPDKPEWVDRHHLYWPRSMYTTDLQREFRNHNFNRVWLPKSEHIRLHNTYNGVFPPDDDIMVAFLDEAAILQQLNVCVAAITMLDKVIYEGRARDMAHIAAHREIRVEAIRETIPRATTLEVVSPKVAELVIAQAMPFALAA